MHTPKRVTVPVVAGSAHPTETVGCQPSVTGEHRHEPGEPCDAPSWSDLQVLPGVDPHARCDPYLCQPALRRWQRAWSTDDDLRGRRFDKISADCPRASGELVRARHAAADNPEPASFATALENWGLALVMLLMIAFATTIALLPFII